MVHCEIGSDKGIATMAGGSGNQHDRITGMHHTAAVNNQQAFNRPAGLCDAGKFGHARQRHRTIMSKLQCLYPATIAHLAKKCDDPA